MTEKIRRIQPGELRKLARAVNFSAVPSLLPANYWHIYIKLEFKKQYENAETKEDGKIFVRNVARAAQAAEIAIKESDGIVVEVQGSVVHCLIPHERSSSEFIIAQCNAINFALHLVFNESSRIEGWRMSADWGKTLLVRGRGIHEDDSYVSLGNAANAPAKHLFRQLSISLEEDRQLKRYAMAWRDQSTNTWLHRMLVAEDEGFVKIAKAGAQEIRERGFEVSSVLSKQARAAEGIRAQAAPLNNNGLNADSASADPVLFFGWVMRADIDGFTSRVEDCFDNDRELMELGQKFEAIMDEAALFAAQHDAMLVQLPWAGDNFTAAVVFSDYEKYRDALQTKLVEFSLDFLDSVNEVVLDAELGGWAQSVAGGEFHGNSQGNIYVGSVAFEGRRFLIAAGKGLGRTTQGFMAMDPRPDELVFFEEDYAYLLKPYKSKLTEREKGDGSQSSLFRKGAAKDLREARDVISGELEYVKAPAKTSITAGVMGRVVASSRDYVEA